ncbi:MAG: hypothetical protein Q8M79_11520 [Dehalococcoidia bacterium]|nr:hypothetical protein [Dehalococcoidia bacterium]
MNIELLWFQGCPNHEQAEVMLRDALAVRGLNVPIQRIDVEDEETGNALVFPGSPTIRIDGRDVEPEWEPCEDCTPRCRLYMTSEGLRGVPAREWIERALDVALAD